MAKQTEEAKRTEQEAKRKPVVTFGPVWTGAGRVDVSVWHNEAGDRGSYSITCRRRYKQGGEYRDAQAFFPADLLPLVELLRAAWAWIIEVQSEKSMREE
jgi:hypothetical protein